jgi:hypothetical protein
MVAVAGGSSARSGERAFFAAMTLAILAAVLIGFARTFFLRPLFPEIVADFAAPEPYFLVHGAFFAAWFLLLAVQASLITARRVDLHRRLGVFGAVLAAAMLVLGVIGVLIAARRPTGFIGVPVPPLQFMVQPLTELVLFAVFVALAVHLRRDSASHKRLMLLGSIALLSAAIVRWPVSLVMAESPVPGFMTTDLLVDLFILPILVWDLLTRGRPHPATLWGAAALILSQPLRWLLAGTDAWLSFAQWATGVPG